MEQTKEQVQSLQQTSAVPYNQNPTVSTVPDSVPFMQHKKNLYPVVRHIFLVICILFAVAFIIFLIHQNGKSIYDNGS
jgi:hypothetical protein